MRLLILRTCCVIERSIYIVQLILDELTQAFAVGFNFIGNDSILRGFGWMIISLFVMLKKARESTYLEFGDGKDENCIDNLDYFCILEFYENVKMYP